MQNISPDMMRTCAKFTAEGRSTDINSENLRKFRRVCDQRVQTDRTWRDLAPFFEWLASCASWRPASAEQAESSAQV